MTVVINRYANKINYVDDMDGLLIGTSVLELPKDQLLFAGELLCLAGQNEDFKISFIKE